MEVWKKVLTVGLLAALLVVTGCGPSPQPTSAPPAATLPAATATSPASTPAVPATAAPTLAGTATTAPTQAATATSLPTATPTTSAAAALAPRSAQVNALAYRVTARGVEGSAHVATITVRRKEEPGLRVGFFDEEVEGTGPQWRASGWTAVTLASLLLGVNPENFEFSFNAGGGWIDGPSAGALTTVGVLAALLGDQVRADAAMTGTINPDGTVGPVGGIPHKVEGAAKAGKKLVLVPAGQRYETDDNLKTQVDVVEVGKKLGVEVRQVANIFEAYEILTGKALPRPKVAGRLEMPSRAFDKMRAATKSWLGRYSKARNRFNSLSEDARQGRTPEYGDQQAQLADRALGEGMVAVAYQRAWEAALDAETSLQAATMDDLRANQGLAPVIDQLKAARTSQQELDAVFDRLKSESARTASETVALMDAWSNLAAAWGWVAQGNDVVNALVSNTNADDDTVLNWIYEAAYDYAAGSVSVDLTRDSLDFGMGFGKAAAPANARVTAMGELLRRAADANLALFESVIVNSTASELGVSPDVMKSKFAEFDGDYRGALLAKIGSRVMFDQVTDEPARSLLTLGSSLTSWAEATIAVAKFYSLDAQVDKDGRVLTLNRERALLEMLNLSEERAQELINLVAAEEPVSAIFYAENARVFRQGDAGNQLVALFYNWQGGMEAHVLAYFTGYYGDAVKAELQKSGRPLDLLRLWDLPTR